MNYSVTLLSSPVLTADGVYEMRAICVACAASLVHRHGFASAVGHQSTAWLFSELLGIVCPVNRITYTQPPGATALVLRLHQRLGEDEVLDRIAHIQEVGYRFVLLHRRL